MEEESFRERQALNTPPVKRAPEAGDYWMICKSKKHPGMEYYFNSTTGISVWNLCRAELERAQPADKQSYVEGCPEPSESPFEMAQSGASRTSSHLQTAAANIHNQPIINNQYTSNPYTFQPLPPYNPYVPMNPANVIPPQMAPPYNPNIWSVPSFYMPPPGPFDHVFSQIHKPNLDNRFGLFMKIENSDNNEEKGPSKHKVEVEVENKNENKPTKRLPVNDLRKVLIAKRRKRYSTGDIDVSNENNFGQEPVQTSEVIEEQMKGLNVSELEKAKQNLYVKQSESAFKKKKSVSFAFTKEENVKGILRRRKSSTEQKRIQSQFDHEAIDKTQGNVEVYNNDGVSDDDEDDEIWIQRNTHTQDGHAQFLFDVSVLKRKCKFSESEVWYIAPDANVFFCNLPFLRVLIEPDDLCRLLVSELVYKELQASAKTSSDKQTEIRARSACRFIAEMLKTGKALTDRSLLINHPELNCPIGDDHILNTCDRLTSVDYHLIFLSNDKLLGKKSQMSRVHTYSVKGLKNLLDFSNIKRKQYTHGENQVIVNIAGNDGLKESCQPKEYAFSYKTADLTKLRRIISFDTQTPANNISVVNAEVRSNKDDSTCAVTPVNRNKTYNSQESQFMKIGIQKSEQLENPLASQKDKPFWGHSNYKQTPGVTKTIPTAQVLELPNSWNTIDAARTLLSSQFPTQKQPSEQTRNLSTRVLSNTQQSFESNINIVSKPRQNIQDTKASNFNQTSAFKNTLNLEPAISDQTSKITRNNQWSGEDKSNQTYNSGKGRQTSNVVRNITFSEADKFNQMSNSDRSNQIVRPANPVNKNMHRKKQNCETITSNQESNVDRDKKTSDQTKNTNIMIKPGTTEMELTETKAKLSSSSNTDMKKRVIRLKRTSALPTKSPNASEKRKIPSELLRKKSANNTAAETNDCSVISERSNKYSNDTVNSTPQTEEINEPSDCEGSIGYQNTTQNKSMRSPRTIEESPTNESVISNTRSSVYSDRTLHTLKQVHLTLANNKTDKAVKIDDTFKINDAAMEESLRTGCEEWTSRFVQIMEEVLSQILQRNAAGISSLMAPPWTMNEATQCITKMFSSQPEIEEAANKFSSTLFKVSDKRGHPRVNMKPHEFMEMFTYGVNLVHSIQKVLRDFDDIRIAIRFLSELLKDIKNPKYFDNSTLPENVDDIPNDSNIEDTSLLQTNPEDSQTHREQPILCDPTQKEMDNTINQNVKIIRKIDNVGLDFKSFKKALERKKAINIGLREPEKASPKKQCTNEVEKPSETKIKRNFRICPEFEKRIERKSLDWDALDYSDEETMNCDEEDGDYLEEETNLPDDEIYLEEETNLSDEHNYLEKETNLLDEENYSQEETNLRDQENYSQEEMNLREQENNENNNDVEVYMVKKFICDTGESLEDIMSFCHYYAEIENIDELKPEKKTELLEQAKLRRAYINDQLTKTFQGILDRERNNPEESVTAMLQRCCSKSEDFANSPLANYRESVEKIKSESMKLLGVLDLIIKDIQT